MNPYLKCFGIVTLLSVILGCQSYPSYHVYKPTWQTYTSLCEWQWVESDLIGLWAEECQFSSGHWYLEWDADHNAFRQKRDDVDMGVVLKVWIGSDLAFIGDNLAHQTTNEVGADCEWKNFERKGLRSTMRLFTWTPSSIEELSDSSDVQVPEDQCGPYGFSASGVRYFMTDSRWPDTFIFVNEGQERPLFEPSSITFFDETDL